MSMLWIWVTVILVCVVLEAVSPLQLVSIWGAISGVVALILELCGVDMAIQIVVFLVLTVILIILT